MLVREENGFLIWTKSVDAPLSAHFRTREFECHCMTRDCGEQRIAVALVQKLEAVRAEYGLPLLVTSGYRCAGEQRALKLGGFETAPGISQHELGNAADVKAARMTVLVPILKAHFKAIGLARSWAHVDLRADKERSWSYKS